MNLAMINGRRGKCVHEALRNDMIRGMYLFDRVDPVLDLIYVLKS